MTSKIEETIELLTRVPLSNGLPYYNYGTAGFRFKAEFMEGLMVRVGILSAILLLLDQDDAEQNVETGVMITASHNDESYNGVKLANPDGSMLTPKQEVLLTKWVNEKDATTFKAFLEENTAKIVDKIKANSTSFVLHVGRDTRSHSKTLSDLLLEGARSFMDCAREAFPNLVVSIRDHGVLTTPMLHHIVLHSNPSYLPDYIEPKNSRKGYIETYAGAYVDLLKGMESTDSIPLRIDGACGVGYMAAQEIFEEITNVAGDATNPTPLVVHNGENDGPLNDSCGSEHVQKQLSPPTWYASKEEELEFPYCCSLDGDADRIVFFGQSKNTLSALLDGDKIAILIAHVLKDKFRKATQAAASASIVLPGIKVGIVQTAYANGASTDYVKENLQIPVLIAKTGVKHLHHAAVEHFDVGIYFEANGHGTVVFSKTYEKFASDCLHKLQNPFFVQLHKLINPAVGDALSDMLLVDYLLRSLGGWTLKDWNSLYQDLPSRMLKVQVQDRNLIECNSNESICLAPVSVQPLLQTVMEKNHRGRCFVRPSGTEDVVRVYAEASTREQADVLAIRAAQIVFDECNGVGARPL